MDLNEKSVVKIDGDGTVVKCAKSLPGSECGYEADKKVCGKCGAMAVEIKMVPVDEEDEEETTDEEDLLEESEEEAPMENGKPMLKTKGAGMWQTPKATRRAYTASMQDGLYRPVKGEEMMPEDDEDEEMYMDDEEYMDEEEKGMYGMGGGGRGGRPGPGPLPDPRPRPRGPRKPGGGGVMQRPPTGRMQMLAEEMMDDEEEMYMDDEENMGMEVTITMKNKSEGKIKVDRKSGILKEKTITTTATGTVASGYGDFPINSTSTSVITIN